MTGTSEGGPMGPGTTLALVTAIAGLVAAPFLRHAFDMLREGHHREMAGAVFLGLLPLVAPCLFWAWTGDAPMRVQNALLGSLGAALGAAALIWIGYVVRPADAQKAKAEASTMSEMLSFEDATRAARASLLDVVRLSLAEQFLREDNQRLQHWAAWLSRYAPLYDADGRKIESLPTPIAAHEGKLTAGGMGSLYVKKPELDIAVAKVRADYPNPQPGSITFHDVEGGTISRNKGYSIGVAKSKNILVDQNDAAPIDDRKK
jgi:hypothetical protein